MSPESIGTKGLLYEEQLYGGCLSLFNFEPGQYGRSMGIDPVAEHLFRRRLPTQPLNSVASGGRVPGPACVV